MTGEVTLSGHVLPVRSIGRCNPPRAGDGVASVTPELPNAAVRPLSRSASRPMSVGAVPIEDRTQVVDGAV